MIRNLPENGEIQTAAERIRDIIKRTNRDKANPKDVQELRAMLQEFPDLWKFAGDLADIAQQHLIAGVGKRPLVAESVRHSAIVLGKSLTLPTDTMLERMLIQQCVTAHLHHYVIELQYQNAREGGASLEQGMYWEKKLSASQRRYLRAIETLARVRRLNQVPVQINIGERQVNIAGNANPADDPGNEITMIESETTDS